MHLVCCCSRPVWRRSLLKKGTPMTYFCPALDPPLDGSGRKTTTLVRDLECFIHTKFHQNPSSGSGEVENVNSLTDGRRTDAGQRVITIGHWSLWLLCPKKWNKSKNRLVKLYFHQEWQNMFGIWARIWRNYHYHSTLRTKVLVKVLSLRVASYKDRNGWGRHSRKREELRSTKHKI